MVLYIISTFASIVILITGIVYSKIRHAEKEQSMRIFSPLQILTMFVFFASVAIFIPVYYVNARCNFGDGFPWVSAFLISIHNAMRLFILDGDFDTIVKAARVLCGSENEWIHILFSIYAAFLYVLAPALTFLNVLHLLQSAIDRGRFRFHYRHIGEKRIIVFSELNEESIALAESIYKKAHSKENDGADGKNYSNDRKDKNRKKKKKVIVVFTDVFKRENSETDYDLLMRTKDIRALLLKSDITRLYKESFFEKRKNKKNADAVENAAKYNEKIKESRAALRELKNSIFRLESLLDVYNRVNGENESVPNPDADVIAGINLEELKTTVNSDNDNISEIINDILNSIQKSDLLDDIKAQRKSVISCAQNKDDEEKLLRLLKKNLFERKILLQMLRKNISEEYSRRAAEIKKLDKHKNNNIGRIDFVIIGHDEAENTEQLLKLNKKYRNNYQKSVGIYIFSPSSAAGYILDSLDKGYNTINIEDVFMNIPKQYRAVSDDNTEDDNSERLVKLLSEAPENGDCGVEGAYRVRRINAREHLAREALSNIELADYLFNKSPAEDEGDGLKYIDLLIVGCGSQGFAFLKTALWLYQRNGYCVRITVIDVKSHKEISDFIRSDCPDIMTDETYKIYADASYRIQIFGGVDFLRSDVYSFFENGPFSKTVGKIKAAFVTLGDDDKNTEAAVRLRRLFDQNIFASKKPPTEDLPYIYTVVYDAKKSANLHTQDKAGITKLKFFGGKGPRDKYGIKFIGSLNEVFSGSIIDSNAEKQAMKYHLEWIRTESELRANYEKLQNPGKKPSDDEKEFLRVYANKAVPGNNKDGSKALPGWGDTSYYEDTTGSEFKDPIAEEVFAEIRIYDDFEYTRDSSIAKSAYKNMTNAVFGDDNGHSRSCRCSECLQKRISEHMRWDMYMRTRGYRYGSKKDHRSRLHPDIKPWTNLPISEQYKD